MSLPGGCQDLRTFPLKSTVLSNLIGAGFSTSGDLSTIKLSELTTGANITSSEALEVLETVFEDADAEIRKVPALVFKSAFDLLQDEQEYTAIVSLCQSLDEMMGGGVPLCKITEFSGAPGIGKTQICLQLVVDVHIPVPLGGVDGEAVYIDTEGSFTIDRIVDMAEATVTHCKDIARYNDDSDYDLTVDKILGGTHYFRCQDHVELIAIVHLLPTFLKQHKLVKLVVVDSIACPFRQNFEDMSTRTRLLTTLAQNLIQIATQFKLAVVLTNQMTTKIAADSSSSCLIPALGESWGHACNTRLILSWEGSKRKALLLKSPNKPETSCTFQITRAGIRDTVKEHAPLNAAAGDYQEQSTVHRQETPDFQDCQPHKKQRTK